jgi:hypothetical protein
MDVASIAANLMTDKAASLQQAVATRVLKQNIDSQKLVLQLLQPAQSAPLAEGVGGKLDISA